MYYKDAFGAMLVFDLSREETFENVLKVRRARPHAAAAASATGRPACQCHREGERGLVVVATRAAFIVVVVAPALDPG